MARANEGPFSMNERPFSIQIGEPYAGDGSPEPDWDPLGELPESEVSFRKFCFRHNHRVDVRVGAAQGVVFLFPDVVLVYPELVGIPRRLRLGLAADVTFAERIFELSFDPKDGTVECRLREFGYRHGSNACLAARTEVEAALTGFVEDLRARALAAGYQMPGEPLR